MCCGRNPTKKLLEKTSSTLNNYPQTTTAITTPSLSINYLTSTFRPYYCKDEPAPNGQSSECPINVKRCFDPNWYQVMTEQCPR